MRSIFAEAICFNVSCYRTNTFVEFSTIKAGGERSLKIIYNWFAITPNLATRKDQILLNLVCIGSVKADPYINNIWSSYFWIWKNMCYVSYNATCVCVCVCVCTPARLSVFSKINIFFPPLFLCLFFEVGRLKSPLRLFHFTFLFLICQCFFENVIFLSHFKILFPIVSIWHNFL